MLKIHNIMTLDETFPLVFSIGTMLNQFPQALTFAFIDDRYPSVYWFFDDGSFSVKLFERMIFRNNVELNWSIKVNMFIFIGWKVHVAVRCNMINLNGIIWIYFIFFSIIAPWWVELENQLRGEIFCNLNFKSSISRICSLEQSSKIWFRFDMFKDNFRIVHDLFASFILAHSLEKGNFSSNSWFDGLS